MINVTLITMGKVQKGFLTDGCNEYIKRLRTMCDFKLVEIEDEPLPEKNLNQTLIDKALEKESGKIISAIPKQSYVIAMCIEGKQLASRDFAKLFNQKAVEGYSSICLIIGFKDDFPPSAFQAYGFGTNLPCLFHKCRY